VWRLDGSCTERSVTLHGAVFDVPIRPDLVHRCVRWQLAKAQAGTHAAKDRSEVSGSGKKPWAQKGTGRARAGSKRSPQFRGGGAVHGPRTRSHAHHLPRKVRRLALKAVLSAKLAEGNLIVVEHAGPGTPKTAALVAALEGLTRARGEPPSDTAPSTLIVDARGEDERPAGADLRRAAANLKRVHVLPSQGAWTQCVRKRGVCVSLC
jgi:large subunit ribosomal protein L4